MKKLIIVAVFVINTVFSTVTFAVGATIVIDPSANISWATNLANQAKEIQLELQSVLYQAQNAVAISNAVKQVINGDVFEKLDALVGIQNAAAGSTEEYINFSQDWNQAHPDAQIYGDQAIYSDLQSWSDSIKNSAYATGVVMSTANDVNSIKEIMMAGDDASGTLAGLQASIKMAAISNNSLTRINTVLANDSQLRQQEQLRELKVEQAKRDNDMAAAERAGTAAGSMMIGKCVNCGV